MKIALDLQQARALLTEVSGRPVRDFFTYDFGRETDPSAISVLMPDADIWNALMEVRQRLEEEAPPDQRDGHGPAEELVGAP